MKLQLLSSSQTITDTVRCAIEVLKLQGVISNRGSVIEDSFRKSDNLGVELHIIGHKEAIAQILLLFQQNKTFLGP
jgi:hypothetical protein